jgi:hypothetical protein
MERRENPGNRLRLCRYFLYCGEQSGPGRFSRRIRQAIPEHIHSGYSENDNPYE